MKLIFCIAELNNRRLGGAGRADGVCTHQAMSSPETPKKSDSLRAVPEHLWPQRLGIGRRQRVTSYRALF